MSKEDMMRGVVGREVKNGLKNDNVINVQTLTLSAKTQTSTNYTAHLRNNTDNNILTLLKHNSGSVVGK